MAELVLIGLGIGLAGREVADGWRQAALLVGAVFLGSALCWLMLAAAAAAFRRRVTPRVLAWINRLSGGVIAGLGGAAMALAL